MTTTTTELVVPGTCGTPCRPNDHMAAERRANEATSVGVW
jgi:hypothetical protein